MLKYFDTVKLCIDKDEYVSSGLHFHDFISVKDMHCCFTFACTRSNGDKIVVDGFTPCPGWLRRYIPDIDWTPEELYIEYNIGDYLSKL